jgi:hypothetical protein
VLSKALWAHRATKHGATKVIPFELVYGQEAVLSVEINLQTCRVYKQETLSVEEYTELMMDTIDEIPKGQFRALSEIEKEKMKVTKAYNKKVMDKSFQVRELVCKAILLVGVCNNKFGK